MHIEKKKFLIKTISDVVAWLAARRFYRKDEWIITISLFLSYSKLHNSLPVLFIESMLSGSIIISIIFIHMLEIINYIHLA